MPVRTAIAVWEGTVKDGNGVLKVGSGAFEVPYNFISRFEEGSTTNPEELLGAAHAGCFTMALSSALGRAGHTVHRIQTTANVHLTKQDGVNSISRIDLHTQGKVDGIEQATFEEFAERTRTGCIVSRALASVETTITATLS